MRSFLKKSIIYVWIVSILINACPVIVFASFLEKEEITNIELEKETEDSQSSLEVVGEIKEKRTLNEKHYLLEDGSIKAFIYPENIHYEENGPTVLLFVGVNGVGKTTTIGKLATKLTKEGKKVLLIAGDTFRAAAA